MGEASVHWRGDLKQVPVAKNVKESHFFFLKKSDIRLSNWFLGSWARVEAKASQLAHGCQHSEGCRVLKPWGRTGESFSTPKPANYSDTVL